MEIHLNKSERSIYYAYTIKKLLFQKKYALVFVFNHVCSVTTRDEFPEPNGIDYF